MSARELLDQLDALRDAATALREAITAALSPAPQSGNPA